MNPFSHTGLSISDSLKSVRKSVLIYETIIQHGLFLQCHVHHSTESDFAHFILRTFQETSQFDS